MSTTVNLTGPDPRIVEMLRKLNEPARPASYRRMRCRHCRAIIESPAFNCVNSHCELTEELGQ